MWGSFTLDSEGTLAYGSVGPFKQNVEQGWPRLLSLELFGDRYGSQKFISGRGARHRS